MRHRKTYKYINFQQIGLGKEINHNRTHKYIRKKIASCINLQPPIVILKKNIISDMRHRKTYIYIYIYIYLWDYILCERI